MGSIALRAGSACICLIAAGILPSVVASSAVFAEEPSAAAAEPLVLELSIDSKLRQEILVREEGDFHVVTQVDGVRWVVEGRIGQIVDAVAPLDVTYRVSGSRVTSHLEMPVDEFVGFGGGGTYGPMLDLIWLRRGFDPVPVLARSIARRGKYLANAVYYLGELGSQAQPAVTELVAVLNDDAVDRTRRPYESIRRGAAISLGKIAPDASAAVDSLVKAVRDENPHVRLASALALWQIARHAAAVPVAVETLADQDHFVRRKAASTLGEMSAETDDALQSLVAALSDEDRYVRIDAALALWGIRRDPLALSCLRNLTQNCPDEKIRRYAARLIQNLEQEQSTELGKE